MNDELIELRITHALPASGKTTWAKKFKKENTYRNHDVIIVNTDSLIKNPEKTYEKLLKDTTNSIIPNVLIIDGLYLTNDAIADVINKTLAYYSNDGDRQTYRFKIIIDTWNEDRPLCIINDELRDRNIKAATTINNAVFESIDLKAITSQISDDRIKSINRHKHYVYEASGEELFYAKNNITFPSEGERKIYSNTWCGGGTWCGYDGGTSEVSPETPPKYFKALVNILETIKTKKPLSIYAYFEIMDNCVEIESDYERDYYGGGVTRLRYTLDLDKFYNYLIEKEYV